MEMSAQGCWWGGCGGQKDAGGGWWRWGGSTPGVSPQPPRTPPAVGTRGDTRGHCQAFPTGASEGGGGMRGREGDTPPALRGGTGDGGVLLWSALPPPLPPVPHCSTFCSPHCPSAPKLPPPPLQHPPPSEVPVLGLQQEPAWPRSLRQPAAPVPPSPKLVRDCTDLLPVCAPLSNRLFLPEKPSPGRNRPW